MEEIKKFLEKGKLVGPELSDEISSLTEDEKEKLLESDSFVLKKRDLQRMRIPEPKISKNEEERKNHVHISDFTNFYLERFNFLREKIQNRVEDGEISSMGKVSSGKNLVIGMVREIDDNKVVVEDNTGEIVLKTDKNFIEDEVIGIKGEVIQNEEIKMAPDKIFHPDVSLNKEVETTDEELEALFISDLNEKIREKISEIEPDYLFISRNFEEKPEISHQSPVIYLSKEYSDKKKYKSGNDPLWVSVENFKILLHDGKFIQEARKKLDISEKEAMLALLKRRHLNPSGMHLLEDKYLLKEVPDVIHVNGDEGGMINYKGVTLLSTTPEEGYLLNLKTRDVKEVDFS